MKQDIGQPQEVDLDKTDVLPILEGTIVDSDVRDDAVPLDHAAGTPGSAGRVRSTGEFQRPAAIDLPSLAESVRSVEERIARQAEEYKALSQAYERTREAEASALARVNVLSAELGAARTALEADQQRSRALEQRLAESAAAAESARTRTEEAVRESQRHQGESHTLRDSLAARDATIAQVLHSLGERDAQFTALQREHAKIVPALEARSQSSAQLEAELGRARAQMTALAAELQASKASAESLAAQFKRSETALGTARLELGTVQAQSGAYLERLRTYDFRHGLKHNLYRELDAEIGAASAALGALRSERDRLAKQLAERDAKLAAQDAAMAKLNSTLAADVAAQGKQAQEMQRSEQARSELTAQVAGLQAEGARLQVELAAQVSRVQELQQSEQVRADLAAQVAALRAEGTRLNAELTARDAAVAEALAKGAGEAQRAKELAAAAEHEHAEQAAQIVQLQSEVDAAEQEMTVLMAHLQEAKRPIQSIEADVKRLNEELSAKTLSCDELNEENRKLRASLERTRGALEEREFLIRRLERSESNNANVLGRIQTSIERLGGTGGGTAAAPAATDISAELIEIKGDQTVAHPLVRRTRIGRATGCELRIDSSSVSRHHALLLLGSRDAVIEDLNSTNGVIVNGRKVLRHLLSDGDAVMIGEVQFRFVVKQPSTPAAPSAAEPPAGA
jgi:chromosome segregation ATPase